MDAEYCAQIIKVIHLQGTPGFSTLHCYDKVNNPTTLPPFGTAHVALASWRPREGHRLLLQRI